MKRLLLVLILAACGPAQSIPSRPLAEPMRKLDYTVSFTVSNDAKYENIVVAQVANEYCQYGLPLSPNGLKIYAGQPPQTMSGSMVNCNSIEIIASLDLRDQYDMCAAIVTYSAGAITVTADPKLTGRRSACTMGTQGPNPGSPSMNGFLTYKLQGSK